MGFDDVVVLIGEFGRYQWRIYFLLFVPALSNAFQSMIGVFLAAQPDFRCLLPSESLENVTYQNTDFDSQCELYGPNLTDTGDESVNSSSTIKCSSFVYDKSTYDLTVTTEFDLVCDRAWLTAASDSILMVGNICGVLIFSTLSDRFGRKPVFCAIIVTHVIFGFLLAATPEIISYLTIRLILGTTLNSMYVVGYVQAVEMVSPKNRNTILVTLQLFWATGVVLTTAFAYFIRHWRFLQIAISIPSLAFLTYCWFLPESARWLLSMGRTQEAKDLLLKAASKNGIILTEKKLDDMLDDTNESKSVDMLEKHSMLDLMRYPNLRRRSLLLFFIWFVNSITYYGLSWSYSDLGSNEYVNFAIGGLVEIPGIIFVRLTLDRWGRRPVLCGCMLVAGISLLLTIFVPTDMEWLVILLSMVGKSAVTASFASVYVVSAEQYPTVIRNVGVGTCSLCARIGGVLAPYIIYMSSIWTQLPVIILGSATLISGLTVMLLPETLNKNLPETIQDAENQFNKNDS